MEEDIVNSINKILSFNDRDKELKNKERELENKEKEVKKKEKDANVLYNAIKIQEKNLIDKEKEFNRYKQFFEDAKIKPLDRAAIFRWAVDILERIPFKTLRDTEEIWMYKGDNYGYFIPRGETYLLEKCAKDIRTNDPSVLKKLTMKIQGDTFIERDDFVNPHNLINMKNGVFDLDTKELILHAAKYMFQYALDIPYDKNATCPVWEKNIRGMFDNDEDFIRTQKWFGYHFTRGQKEQIAHGYFGESGSGRSQMLHILIDLLGVRNVTNFSLQSLNNPDSYAVGRMFGKLANIKFDMQSTPLKDITLFKELVAGDRINARNIYESPFEFNNSAKISWACNKLPYGNDFILKDPAFKRRIMLTKTHVGYDEIDKDIYKKYFAELPGIFNWTIEGYYLYQNEGFNYNENVYQIWKDNMDMTFQHKTNKIDNSGLSKNNPSFEDFLKEDPK